MVSRQPLKLFMPGAFAQVSKVIQQEFALVAPETELVFHEFIPSGLLAREIRAGAPADIYVSANTRYMDELFKEGLVAEPGVLAGNRLVIIATPGAPLISGLDDLLDPSLKLVVPQRETDPCGQYIAAMFGEAGIAERMHEKLTAGSLVHSRGSGDLPGFLFDGRVVAGIFYASEAKALSDTVRTISIPESLDFHDRVTFTIAKVVQTENHPATGRMIEWLLGDEGQRVLTDAGFLPKSSASEPATWIRGFS